jgi:hypothetical protein
VFLRDAKEEQEREGQVEKAAKILLSALDIHFKL